MQSLFHILSLLLISLFNSFLTAQQPSCSDPINLSRGKPTEQSSRKASGYASLAADGILTGGNPWRGEIQHTTNQAQPWWQVDLGSVATLSEILIYNRTDCCQSRLRDFVILLSEEAFPSDNSLNELLDLPFIHTLFYQGSTQDLYRFPTELTARYVRIQLRGSNSLHMAEVQVMGCPIESAPPTLEERFPPVETSSDLQALLDCSPPNIPSITPLTPSQDQNYIRTIQYRARGAGNFAEADKVQQITYYDGLGRPIQSINGQGTPQGKDLLTPLTYDAWGRQSFAYLPFTPAASLRYGDLDKLSYTYLGNRLNTLSDAAQRQVLADVDHFTTRVNGAAYRYDANGNIQYDPHKGITYTYNHLNKPIRAEFRNNSFINWIYSADGTKLQQQYSGDSSATHDYVGGFFYVQKGSSDRQLQHLIHEEGRALKLGNRFRYEFDLKDNIHLGNVRLSFTDKNGNGTLEKDEVLSAAAYYPFGLKMSGFSFQSGTEKRLGYNGKEWHQELGLGLYDYGARMYDPALGRFTGIDPVAEDFNWVTTYNYAENEPIAHIDLWGLQKAGMQIGLANAREHVRKNGGDLEAFDSAVEKNAAISRKVAYSIFGALGGASVIARYGLRAVALFLFNEVKDETLSRATGGASDVIDLTRMGTKLATEGVKRLSKSLNEFGSITNLSEVDGALDLDNFNTGQGFSGVMDETTGAIVMYPSAADDELIRYANGEQIPDNLRVSNMGGHRTVNEKMTEAIGQQQGKRTGFALVNHGDKLEVRFNSGQVNYPNHGNRAAPAGFQNQIMDALRRMFGDRYTIVSDQR